MDEDAKRKIAALLKMTARAGCTEAEAIAAAEKAARLMQEHGLSEADVLFVKAGAKAKVGGRSIRARLWSDLAVNTNTAVIYTKGEAVFVGKDPGPAIAAYLYVVLDRAIDSAVAEFKGTPNYKRRRSLSSKRRAVQDFTAAMIVRLASKLRHHFAPVRSDDARRAALAARDELFPDGRPVKPATAKLRNAVAINMGTAAGSKVVLHHGMGAEAAQPRIGA